MSFFSGYKQTEGLVAQAGNEEATVSFGAPKLIISQHYYCLLCSLRQILMNTQVPLFLIFREESSLQQVRKTACVRFWKCDISAQFFLEGNRI